MGIGLPAVMEELENRAQIKHQDDYTGKIISGLDDTLLSGGAGAKCELLEFEKETVESSGSLFPAGKTPAQGWETLINSRRKKIRDPNLGVYTEITRLAYRDYQNLPDSRYNEDVKTYGRKSFEVIQNENYAVIFFGNKKGWKNAPFRKRAQSKSQQHRYAYRTWETIYNNIPGIKKHRLNNDYKRLSVEMYKKAQSTLTPDKRRMKWLKSRLKRKRILTG